MPGVDKKSGGLLDGLKTATKKPAFDQKKNLGPGGHGFIMTPKQHKIASEGGTPSGYVRDKDGNLRALVQ